MILRWFGGLLFPFFSIVAMAQPTPFDSSYNNAYYQSRMDWFRTVGGQSGAVVFLGNSLTERGLWHELLPGQKVMNRGIGGDNTFGVLARLSDVLTYKPRKIFLLIGINDIGRGHPVALIAERYRRIVHTIRHTSPNTKLYLQSLLPLNENMLTAAYLKGRKDSITALNQFIQTIAATNGATYVDLYWLFSSEEGQLKEQYSLDGIHLKPAAYVAWVNFLKNKNYL